MAFNTGNPVPSNKAEDLSDNAENLDSAVNSTGATWTDRLGVTRQTVVGATNSIDAASTQGLIDIAQDVSDVEASADAFDVLALDRVNKIGVIYDSPIRDWSASLLVDDLRAHRYPATTGDIYIPKKALPFTTSATFEPADWNLLQGVSDGDIINDLSQSFDFESVASFKSSSIDFPLGKTIKLADRNADFKVIAGNPATLDYDIIFSSTVSQSLELIRNGAINLKSVGVTNSSTADNLVIQYLVDKLNSEGGGTIFYPDLDLDIQTTINFKSNVNHVGVGIKSNIKVGNAAGIGQIFNQSSSDVENVLFYRLGFDGTLNYPADSTVYAPDYTRKDRAIRTAGVKATNIIIDDCDFNSLSDGCIDINGNNTSNVTISNNRLKKGGYAFKAILVRTATGYTDEQRPSGITVFNNTLDENGPQYWHDPSKSNYISSVDGIHLDSCKDSVVTYNKVNFAGSVGIRIEECVGVTVDFNIVKDSGAEGMIFYRSSKSCTGTGNIVRRWGRTPPASSMRSYGGAYYIAREFPNASDAVLPADPSGSSWFEVWPYSLDNILTANIIAYSATDYYTTGPDGILPFRGGTGIAYTSLTIDSTLTGNQCIGDKSLDGSGKFKYAADFGYSAVNQRNTPAEGNGQGMKLAGNQSNDHRVYSIYHPEYEDPINENGLLGVAEYIGNQENDTSVFSGALNYSKGVYETALTSAGGTITLGNKKLNWTKVGRAVTISGEVVVTSVSSPTGVVTLTLPFAGAANDGRSARSNYFLFARDLTGAPTGYLTGNFDSNTTEMAFQIAKSDYTVDASVGPYMQATTTIRLNFTYQSNT